MEPITLRSSCPATGLNYYIVDPKGDLYTCWSNIGLKQFSIGNLTTGTKLESNYINWLSVKYPEKCKECKLLPVCQSGCPYNIVHNNTPKCNVNAKNLVEVLKAKCRKAN